MSRGYIPHVISKFGGSHENISGKWLVNFGVSLSDSTHFPLDYFSLTFNNHTVRHSMLSSQTPGTNFTSSRLKYSAATESAVYEGRDPDLKND